MMYGRVPIGELVTLRQGFAINKNTNHHMSKEKTNLHLLRIGDMKDGNFSVFVKDTIPKKFIADENDIIYTRTGQVGLVFRRQRGVVHNNCFTVVTNDENVLQQAFIYYALQEKSFYEEAISRATGAAQPDLPHGAFNSIQIYLPPVDAQKRITEILDAYDNLIENNQKQIKLLEEAAQRLYKEWFVDLRFPGHEHTKITDGIPDGWSKLQLTEIAPIVTGKKDANFGTDDGKYLFFTCAQEPIHAPSYSFDCDAVILAGNGDFNVKLYRGKFEVYQRTYVFSPYDTKNLYVLYYAVKDNMRQLFQGASGSTIKFLTKRMLEEIKVFIPTEDILNGFTNSCESYQRKIEVLKMQINGLTQARDRLLPKLMNSEIQV